VGEGEFLQHSPFSVSFVLPAEITWPVQEQDMGVTTVTSIVVTSGKIAFSFLQPVPITMKNPVAQKMKNAKPFFCLSFYCVYYKTLVYHH